jgi:hypothetical protein
MAGPPDLTKLSLSSHSTVAGRAIDPVAEIKLARWFLRLAAIKFPMIQKLSK